MSQGPSQDELEATLRTVREAYRVVHAYQRRVLDMMAALDREFATRQLSFSWWSPACTLRPPERSSRSVLGDRWAWDLSPGVAMSFAWSHEPSANAPWRRVLVLPIAEWIARSNAGGEPDGDSLGDASERRSKIVVRCEAASGRIDWDELWLALSSRPGWRQGTQTFSVGATACAAEVVVDESLSRIRDTDALRERVVTPVAKWFEENADLRA